MCIVLSVADFQSKILDSLQILRTLNFVQMALSSMSVQLCDYAYCFRLGLQLSSHRAVVQHIKFHRRRSHALKSTADAIKETFTRSFQICASTRYATRIRSPGKRNTDQSINWLAQAARKF